MSTHLAGWLAWLFIGAISGGVIAAFRKPDQSISNISYVLVGTAGAFIGGLLFAIFGGQPITGFSPNSFAVALVGAAVLLGILLSLDDHSIAH